MRTSSNVIRIESVRDLRSALGMRVRIGSASNSRKANPRSSISEVELDEYNLELEMESRAKNIYRTAVCIVSRIRHELIIDSKMDVLSYLDIVIDLDHFFERVMRQFPTTDQRPQTPCREKSAMGGADSVY